MPIADLVTSEELEQYPGTEFRPSNAPRRSAIRKTIYTLNIDQKYDPRVCELTYPLIQNYADKIGANFHIITERKRPEWPVTIEKFQVAELASRNGDDWSIFVDSDTLISPEQFDITAHLSKDTVAHNGKDMSSIRFNPDKYFMRDGRFIGSCTWFVVASDWTVQDLWQLPQESPEETFKNIHITIGEHSSGHCQVEHLIDDYTLSRNIARFGLKFTTVIDICGNMGFKAPQGQSFSPYFFHLYTLSTEEKLARMLAVLSSPNGALVPNPYNPQAPPWGAGWGVMDPAFAAEKRKQWGIK